MTTKKLAACVLAVGLLAACAKETIQPAFKSENAFEGGEIQSTPNFAQFKELPIPERATMNLEKTLMFGNAPMVGRVVFKAPYTQSGLFDFYMQEMPKFGWRELTTIRTTNSVLTFTRDNRVAVIQLTSLKLGRTEVVIDISTTKRVDSY